MKENVKRLNFFYKTIYGENINMFAGLDYRIKLQKLIYILQSEGVNFGYDFTWYIYGPYASQLARDGYAFKKEETNSEEYITILTSNEQNIIEKIRKGRDILEDADKAEIIASLLYLKERCKSDDVVKELTTRKPRFNINEIQRAAQGWNKLTNSALTRLH
jgi:uncharacterized protein YwgA